MSYIIIFFELVVSLSKPPLYSVPLFQFISKSPSTNESHGPVDLDRVSTEYHNDVWDPLYYDNDSGNIFLVCILGN